MSCVHKYFRLKIKSSLSLKKIPMKFSVLNGQKVASDWPMLPTCPMHVGNIGQSLAKIEPVCAILLRPQTDIGNTKGKMAAYIFCTPPRNIYFDLV